jgi:hypothetical protein
MIKNEILHYLAKSKFNLLESSVSNDGQSFVITGANGETYTEKDFTKTELDKAQKDHDNAIAAEIATKAAEKSALLAKLGITEDEAKLLLS